MLYSFDNRKPQIGKETYVSESALLIGDIKVGNNCYIGHGAILRGDYGTIEIGDGTAVEEGVVIHAPPEQICRIGEKVTLGHGAIVHSKSIGDFAVIGMGAVLSVRAEIGERSIIAEGSVVKREQRLPGGVVAVGNPARVAREVSHKDNDHWNGMKQVYIDLAKKYLNIGMHKLD
jgi:carbonic anhydrase/acetyltransferase-like protein (isoleucine patch superfamily)